MKGVLLKLKQTTTFRQFVGVILRHKYKKYSNQTILNCKLDDTALEFLTLEMT